MSGHRIARTLVYTHRWLGIVLGGVFVLWFASGIVMIFARMPVLDPAERLAALSPIDFASVRVAPGVAGGEVSQFTLTTFAGRPVYRTVTGGVRQTIFADTGEVLAPLTGADAILAAIPFVERATIRHDARLEDADQWTLSVRGHLPLHRLAVDDAEGTRLYVAENGGDVVMKTTTSSRRWGYLSMDPWDWSPSTTPTRAQRDAVSSGPLNPADVSLPALRKALAAFGVATPKEIALIRFRGFHYLRAATGLVAIDEAAQGPYEMFDADDILAAAQNAMPGVPIEGVYWMDEYDPYYYSRSKQLNLPVLRVRFGDPQRTWLYLDPRQGAIVRKEEKLSRLNRWLHHGLNGLDLVTTLWAACRRD